MTKPGNIVVDTSVLVKWVNSENEKYLDQADKLRADVKSGKMKLFAPELSKYEVGNVLLNKKFGLPLAIESFSTIFASPIKFVELDEKMAEKTMEISMQVGMTFYDASFLSLADKIEGTVVTDNFKDMGKYSKVKVIDLKDYK